MRSGTLDAKPRTQSSIAVTGAGAAWVLLNASPDILTQLRAFPEFQPARAVRDAALAGVVLVDSQIDHTTGLLMLREGDPLRVYCTRSVHEDLVSGNPLFTILRHYCGVEWRPIDTGERSRFRVDGAEGLAFRAIAVAGNAPPYSPRRDRPDEGTNIGVLVTDEATGATAFYAPGLARIDAALERVLSSADCLLVDGTFWTDDEMVRLGIGAKRARDMGHLPQSGSGGMLEVLARCPRARKILIHINNTNPILDEHSPEHANLSAAGVEVAYDGMEIAL